jgi:3-oxoacyl-[acyl-carrier protein] reductase
MTESAFDLPSGDGTFDPLAPANNTPIVVALCSDAAQGITGQVFHIFGGAVNMLTPWSPGELFARDDAWEATELLDELLARLPDGAAPTGLVEMLEQVGGTYTPK